MDWIVGIFILFGFLFFWGVWIFGYWLPMAKQARREFELEKRARKFMWEDGDVEIIPPPKEQKTEDAEHRDVWDMEAFEREHRDRNDG